MSEEHYSKKVWTELAAFGLLAALLGWILYHSLHSKPVASNGQATPEFVPQASPQPATIPSVGIPPITLPGQSGGCGDCGGCSGGGCAVGSTTSPTLSAIVSGTNAAIAAMNLMSQQTLQMEANIGNEYSGGFINYSVANAS